MLKRKRIAFIKHNEADKLRRTLEQLYNIEDILLTNDFNSLRIELLDDLDNEIDSFLLIDVLGREIKEHILLRIRDRIKQIEDEYLKFVSDSTNAALSL